MENQITIAPLSTLAINQINARIRDIFLGLKDPDEPMVAWQVPEDSGLDWLQWKGGHQPVTKDGIWEYIVRATRQQLDDAPAGKPQKVIIYVGKDNGEIQWDSISEYWDNPDDWHAYYETYAIDGHEGCLLIGWD